MPRMWTIHARDGHVALTLGWYRLRDEPYRVRDWVVGKAKAEDYPGIIGQHVAFTGNIGRAYDTRRGRSIILDTNDSHEWHRERDKERIRKPPKRKGAYDYEYRDGDWRKTWL